MKNIQYKFLILIFIVLTTGFYHFWTADFWTEGTKNHLSICNDTNKLIEATVFLDQTSETNEFTENLDLKPNRCTKLKFTYKHYGKVYIKSRNSDYQVEVPDVLFYPPSVYLPIEDLPQRFEVHITQGKWW